VIETASWLHEAQKRGVARACCTEAGKSLELGDLEEDCSAIIALPLRLGGAVRPTSRFRLPRQGRRATILSYRTAASSRGRGRNVVEDLDA
jgi:hypothetical protein